MYPILRECKKCSKSLTLDQFGTNRRYADGKSKDCRKCLAKSARENYQKNPEKYREAQARRRKPENVGPTKRRERHLRSTYGITLAEEAAMLEEQQGKCPICNNPAEVVDHCHISGIVRGLLCHKCNRGLGHFNDSPALLSKALTYLTAQASLDRRPETR